MRGIVLGVLLVAACGDEGKRGVGSTCEADQECESGFCYEQACFEPQADSDGDGLVNTIERGLGTSVKLADTDGDGIDDATEIGDVAAPRDSDGDGLIDARESDTADADGDCVPDQADPANDDATIPGDRCGTSEVVTTLVSTPGNEPDLGVVTNLVGGGFAATWNESPPEDTTAGGRVVVFFDEDGVEVSRVDKLGTGARSYVFYKSITALRNGEVVVGYWDFGGTPGHFATQRYSAIGAPIGQPVIQVEGTSPVRDPIVVAHTEGNYGLAYIDIPQLTFVIRYVDANDQPSPTIRGRPMNSPEFFHALGLAGGATLALSREPSAVGGPAVLSLKRFGNDGQPDGSDVVIADGATTRSGVIAQRTDGSIGVFYLTGAATQTTIAYRLLSEQLVVDGDEQILVANEDGCPRKVVGGFDALDQPFAAIGDLSCVIESRGWLKGPDGVLPIAIAVPDQVANVYGLSGSGGGPATFMYVQQSDAGPNGVFVTRVGPDGAYLTTTVAR